jgi:hypothetical protein
VIVSICDGSNASAFSDIKNSHTLIIRTADDIFPRDVESHSTDPVVMTNEDTKALSLTIEGGGEVRRERRLKNNLQRVPETDCSVS